MLLGRTNGIVARAWGRVRRESVRARDRVRGWPIRAACRRQGLPLPPGRLMHLVTGAEDVAWFLDSGGAAARGLRTVLDRNGLALESFQSVLDFGCGAGRVLRHWKGLVGPSLHGADANPDLIAWCRANLPFARFHVNGLERGLAVGDASFDLIYALSVFTHLSEPLQRFWIDELTRVVRPGGYLLLTTHGEHYLGRLSAEERDRFGAGRLVVHASGDEGSNDCAAFHPEAYVRATLARGLDVLDFLAEGAVGNPRQDVYLLRKPAPASVQVPPRAA
jgi:SAM-dependent methyltransferase